MRALLVALFALSTSCSLTIDTRDLAGRAPPDDASTSADGAPSDASTDAKCDPGACSGHEAKVFPLEELAPCARETVERLACRRRIAEKCIALDPCCFHGGFGPIDFPNASEATVMCLNASTYTASTTEFVASGTRCPSLSSLGSRQCDAAVQASAKKRGLGAAILQKVEGTTATLIGVPPDEVDVDAAIAWSELGKLVPECTFANVETQACSTAAHRFCVGGEVLASAGFGPVEWTASTVKVACLY